MKILSTQQLTLEEIMNSVRRSRSSAADVKSVVLAIMEQVRCDGDRALFDLSKRFDGATLSSLKVSKSEIKQAYKLISPELIYALKQAKRNIEKFHRTTMPKKERRTSTVPGVRIWREFRPIECVGLYVPGGKAAYPSTVLMLGIPAKQAGCQKIILCTPASKENNVNPAVLVAADLCGITEIFKVGGAQAIAAMAYGTESIPKVSKIFGPGNQFVTAAKMLAYGEVDIDMPAGPSEVEIITDETADPTWIAADLLSQLEHGADSQALLVTFSEEFAEQVIQAMQKEMQILPRKAIVEQAFKKSFAVIVRSMNEACEITNAYAPEHLEIICKNEKDEAQILKKIINVGSIFLGKFTTEPLGDYATGANHTLPTSGFAKMFSPVSTASFGKMIQVERVSKKGIGRLRKTVETLAAAEGLDAHKYAVTIRFL
ncbi:histidinol dehydrogenase [Candidatus Peregrinibacteria bacterium]|nr:histidinol dehydrogenase [Candidatus Peregrinibacteria bacterium]